LYQASRFEEKYTTHADYDLEILGQPLQADVTPPSCTTRIVAGVDVPQVTPFPKSPTRSTARRTGIADGGIRSAGDVSKERKVDLPPVSAWKFL
jgi:hypothetical protein